MDPSYGDCPFPMNQNTCNQFTCGSPEFPQPYFPNPGQYCYKSCPNLPPPCQWIPREPCQPTICNSPQLDNQQCCSSRKCCNIAQCYPVPKCCNITPTCCPRMCHLKLSYYIPMENRTTYSESYVPMPIHRRKPILPKHNVCVGSGLVSNLTIQRKSFENKCIYDGMCDCCNGLSLLSLSSECFM